MCQITMSLFWSKYMMIILWPLSSERQTWQGVWLVQLWQRRNSWPPSFSHNICHKSNVNENHIPCCAKIMFRESFLLWYIFVILWTLWISNKKFAPIDEWTGKRMTICFVVAIAPLQSEAKHIGVHFIRSVFFCCLIFWHKRTCYHPNSVFSPFHICHETEE